MKTLFRIIVFALLSTASCALAAFTEFYVQTTGSDVNAGSSNADAALVTNSNGNWDSTTGVFVCSGATDLSGVSVGMFASIYNDGATVAVFVSRITAVVDATDTITVSLTAVAGTPPTTSATGRTIKIGGAWAGATSFPFNFVASTLTNSAGDGPRVNIKSGSYSVGTTTVSSGIASAVMIFRGYNSTIGDLDNQGRNADGTLNTTNMPDITITGLWTPGSFSFLQNLDITGALSSALIGTTANDVNGTINCNIVNTQNNASARAFQGDDGTFLINSDFYCSGAAHASVVDCDVGVFVYACRFRGTSTSALLTPNNGVILNSAFYGNASSTGITWQTVASPTVFFIWSGCTFYGIGTPVVLANALNSGIHAAINNIATDSSKWVDSLYAGTATVPLIELNNRTRDITTLLTGIATVQAGAVTTDGGGAETDYVNAGAGNFRPADAAPGLSVGLTPYIDIGAYQKQPSAGGGQRSYSF